MITTTTSPTARFLEEAIRNSDLTQSEIAVRAGFPKPNVQKDAVDDEGSHMSYCRLCALIATSPGQIRHCADRED